MKKEELIDMIIAMWQKHGYPLLCRVLTAVLRLWRSGPKGKLGIIFCGCIVLWLMFGDGSSSDYKVSDGKRNPKIYELKSEDVMDLAKAMVEDDISVRADDLFGLLNYEGYEIEVNNVDLSRGYSYARVPVRVKFDLAVCERYVGIKSFRHSSINTSLYVPQLDYDLNKLKAGLLVASEHKLVKKVADIVNSLPHACVVHKLSEFEMDREGFSLSTDYTMYVVKTKDGKYRLNPDAPYETGRVGSLLDIGATPAYLRKHNCAIIVASGSRLDPAFDQKTMAYYVQSEECRIKIRNSVDIINRQIGNLMYNPSNCQTESEWKESRQRYLKSDVEKMKKELVDACNTVIREVKKYPKVR